MKLIVGAGPSGLAIAYELAKKNLKVTIIEQSNKIGGLSKSEIINNCYVDMGAHLFYGVDQQVFFKVLEIVDNKNEWVNVQRKGKLYVDKKYIDWPFKITSIFQLSLKLKILFFIDIIKKFLVKKNIIYKNYDDVIKSIYGKNFNNFFFKPMTEKFLKGNSKKISPDWAIASLRAATKINDSDYKLSNKYLTKIDGNLIQKDFSLIDFFIKNIFLDKKKEPFFYFKKGYGTIVENYFKKIINFENTNFYLNTKVSKIIIKNNLIESVILDNEKIIKVEDLIWTGGINSLAKLCGSKVAKIKYMHSIFCYVFLNEKFYPDFDCCYYADRDICFQRLTINSEYTQDVILDDKIKSVGCFELSTRNLDQLKDSEHQTYIKNVIQDAIRIGLFKKENIIDSKIICCPYSYPVFENGYREEIESVIAEMKYIKNLHIVGRQGRFSYENVDLIIKEAINHPILKNK
jgi:protoporphyrinogen oxidase